MTKRKGRPKRKNRGTKDLRAELGFRGDPRGLADKLKDAKVSQAVFRAQRRTKRGGRQTGNY